MSKLSFALSILVLPFAFHTVQAQTAEAKIGTATVSGRVTLKGEPARGVVVLLQSEEAMRAGDRSPGSRMKTDENGRFRFASLKAGRYTLIAFAPGFVTPGENTFGSRAKSIDLADGENVENQEIALKRGAVITGRVTDSNGKPLVEQRVELTRLDDRGQPARVALGFSPFANSTDDRGIYRIYGLQAGRYLVGAGFAQREGSIMVTVNRAYYQFTYHPDTTEQSKAKVIDVSEGFEATGIDIKMADAKKTYDVFGRVVSADTGQPIAGVTMFFGSLMDGGKRIGATGSFGNKTDAQGEFQIPGVLPGKYAAFAGREQDSDLYSEPVLFEIGDEDVTGLVVRMRRGGSISGVAVIEGTNDPAILSKLSQIEVYANVISEELSSPSGSPANIGPGGSFALRGVNPGMAKLNIYNGAETPRFSILRIERDGAPQREGIQINPGEQVTGVRIVIGAGTNTLRGHLRITGGSLPEDAILIVRAYRAGTEIVNGRSRQVEAGGRFVIEGLTPGEYELKLSAFFPSGPTPETGKLTERLNKRAQAVTVSGNQETQVTFVIDLTPKEGEQ
ncbi:MAG TPA: carboxypeptidase regulatory-like domain-containing protein [Blastocatellia bacterium]|nr:carboxypeptidase regulatory-like domain-containing protein [Blastocatellia bacterium]